MPKINKTASAERLQFVEPMYARAVQAGQLVALVLFFEMLDLYVARAFQGLLGLTLFPFVPLYAWRSIKIAMQTADIEAAKKHVELH